MAQSSSSRKRRQKKLFDSDSDSDKENAVNGLSSPAKLVKKDLHELKEERIAAFKKGIEYNAKEFDIPPSSDSENNASSINQFIGMQRSSGEHGKSQDNELFDRPPQNEHCSKDQGEDTEVYETSESSQEIIASTSSRKKKLSSVLDSDSEDDFTSDAGLTPTSKVGKRIIPLSKEKVKRNLCLQELQEKRKKKADSESPEELPSVHDASLIDDDDDDDTVCSQDVPDVQQVGESSEELPSTYDESFIDDTAVNSQDEQRLEEQLRLIQRPSEWQAYMYYLRVALTNLVNNNNSTNETELDQWYEKCKNLLEDTLSSKKNLVSSTRWSNEFLRMIKSPHTLKVKLHHTVEDKCQKFELGIFCAKRGALFHDLHNHLSVELQKKCRKKVNEVTMEMDSASEFVEYCMRDEDWTEKLFQRFKYLRDEADKWAENGVERRNMIAVCSKYN
ncbi:uncharacterized protein [Porites lutea]|uniref:uncharacterized protein isoform X2 n=1 Tax=Porites lutea TaxID=51062 RepID=UPI003CC59A1F